MHTSYGPIPNPPNQPTTQKRPIAIRRRAPDTGCKQNKPSTEIDRSFTVALCQWIADEEAQPACEDEV